MPFEAKQGAVHFQELLEPPNLGEASQRTNPELFLDGELGNAHRLEVGGNARLDLLDLPGGAILIRCEAESRVVHARHPVVVLPANTWIMATVGLGRVAAPAKPDGKRRPWWSPPNPLVDHPKGGPFLPGGQA